MAKQQPCAGPIPKGPDAAARRARGRLQHAAQRSKARLGAVRRSAVALTVGGVRWLEDAEGGHRQPCEQGYDVWLGNGGKMGIRLAVRSAERGKPKIWLEKPPLAAGGKPPLKGTKLLRTVALVCEGNRPTKSNRTCLRR